MHLTTDALESLGRDLCRTVLVYQDMYVPPELENLTIFANKATASPNYKNISLSLDKKQL